ncbi:iduronate 2-sulfatase [Onthophagus taurus]|uniref:iduronate 2-sulfatase n=1 Tax=Onthophagus taurus TaxID=166361 RepID=UPI000C209BA3|nr:iduronate 2-sulfatase [Onthophagus taurus]
MNINVKIFVQFLMVINFIDKKNFGYCKRQNILLIVVDDLRPSLGIYGDKNAYTPNIDSLSKRSFVFKHAFCQQSLCAPSRNSFLTSRRPDTLRLYDFYSYWRDSVGNFTTLPQHFKEHGYITHSIGKVFHPGISSNFTDDNPYSWSGKPFHPITEKYKDAKTCRNRDGTLGANLICPVIVKEQPKGTLPDIEILEAAIDFLKTIQNEKCPYFLAVGFHKPHIPFKFPVEYLRFHQLNKIKLPKNHARPSSMPTVAWNPWTDVREREDIDKLNISFPFGEMPLNQTKEIIQAYSASISYIDDLIGTLLQQIDRNTIVVLLGDHGWSLGEHGEFAKYSNFDVATRVPLIIQVPGMTQTMIVLDDLVELVDLFPTLVDLTQITSSLEPCPRICEDSTSKLSLTCTEGRSLVPIMVSSLQRKNVTDKDAVFMQYPRPGTFPSLMPNSDKPRLKNIKVMGYSIRTKTHRYTEWIGFNSKKFKRNWKKVYGRELYDHNLDSQEVLNLAEREELKPLVEYFSKRLRGGWKNAFL